MLSNGNPNRAPQNSHMFTLRMWLEDLGNGQLDWRGKVQHINSGEVIYFRSWQTLEAFIEGLLNKDNPEGFHTQEDI